MSLVSKPTRGRSAKRRDEAKKSSEPKKMRVLEPIDKNAVIADGAVGIWAIGWQATLPSAKERLSYLLMSEILADIYFIFRDSSNGTVQAKIPAHKLVLSVGSAVFEAMFRFGTDSSTDGGSGGARSKDIQELELVDVECESFEALLTFLYTDDTRAINNESAMSILYTAKKYGVPALETACVDFLGTHLDADNVFMLLSKAWLYDEKHLADKCWDMIDKETDEAMKSADFLSIDHATLCMVLSRDTLRVDELALFRATLNWAVAKCHAKALPSTTDNHRLVLGAALSKLRFPLIPSSDFAKFVAPTKLLTDAEMVSVLIYHQLGPKHSVPFPTNQRELAVKRFLSVYTTFGYGGTLYRLGFEVDTPVFVLGFGLYGSYQVSWRYTVLIKILHFDSGKLVASNECVFCSNGSPSTYRVLFDEPVKICADTKYIAWAMMTNHPVKEQYCGTEGLREIKIERNGRASINWHFQDAPGGLCGTCVEEGQIPEIIFHTETP